MATSPVGNTANNPQPPLITATPTDPKVAAKNRVVSEAVKNLNAVGAAGASHEFSIAIDPATRQAVVRIVDSNTNELVEQLPSEYILRVAQQLSERIAKQSASQTDKTS